MGGNFVSRLLDSTLLTPCGNVTKINKKDFWNLDEHIKPGDKIAWHRPYPMIHEAIVLQVDALKSEVWVFERTKTKDDKPWAKGIGKITKVDPTNQLGQLYRYNDTRDPESLKNILKQVLMNLNTKGYNLFTFNCQTSASGVKTDGKDKSSYQTLWFATKILMEAIGIPFFSEMLEKVYGGPEWIGIASAGILHILAFVIELIAVLFKYKRRHMSRDDLRTVISRELLMHIGGWFGNILSSYVKVRREFPQTKGIVPIVLGLFFAIVTDALLLYAQHDANSWLQNLQYPVMTIGAETGFLSGFADNRVYSHIGAYLEFLVSMILGFAGTCVGHILYHAGSWLFEWFTEQFKGQYEECKLENASSGVNIIDWEKLYHELMEDDNISKEDKKILQKNFPIFQESLLSEQSCNHNNINGENNENEMIPDNQPSSASSRKVFFGSK